MKLTQDNIIKLGLGAAGGYVIADFLIPNRGFASKQSCPSGKYCHGICCNHITNSHIQASDAPGQFISDCQTACGWTLNQADTYWRQATGDPHGALIGEPYQEAVKASSWPVGGGGGGGGGGGPGDWLNKIPIGWIVIGGAALALILVLKR